MALDDLMTRELERFRAEHPRSHTLSEQAKHSLLGGVPMNWMVRWPGGFPVFAAEAEGARFTDVDGHEYVDFCLGDTGAMTGHAPEPALARDRRAGAARDHADAAERGRAVGGRGDGAALRAALLAVRADRDGRQPLRAPDRPRDHRAAEDPRLQLVLPRHRRRDVRHARAGRLRRRARGHRRAAVPAADTTRVVEFNDVEALERELAHGDVACVLAEPALTNIGIVLPEPGYHEALREATRRTGTLLIIDETHTICAGPGGYTAAHGLEPDMLTIGKPLGRRRPAGAYGFSEEVAARANDAIEEQLADIGGIGGTLAANVLSLAVDARDARRGPDRGGVRAHDRARRALRGGRAAGHRRRTRSTGT